jgi:hypothetical protein
MHLVITKYGSAQRASLIASQNCRILDAGLTEDMFAKVELDGDEEDSKTNWTTVIFLHKHTLGEWIDLSLH